jgi:signal transduction histidine kinase
VRAWAAGNEVRIAVEDTGIGLTIARHLVRAHHGRLTATSRSPDEGSTFTIGLPITR